VSKVTPAMIPVFEPQIGDREVESVVAALRRGEISGSFGEALPRFESEFAEFVGAEYGVAVTSGTTALQLAVAAAGIQPGDEILISASTNIATAVACVHQGAVPVPVDSEDETWNLDLDVAESLIGERTRAIMPVHLFGHPVDMDAVEALAAKHGLLVIDDAAEAHGAEVRGRRVGSFGDMSCWSFYANKIITTGEGGMVTTSDAALADRLRSLRNLAYGREQRLVHEDVGFNFRMTGYQAALGLPQLARIEETIEAKRRLAHTYDELLDPLSEIRRPVESDWARHVYWMYAIVLGEEIELSRDEVAARLRERGVDTRTFFCPMNLQPALRKVDGFRAVDCPVAERLWERGLYLPSSPGLERETVERVVAALGEVVGA
jgi:perosamine synthetase